MGGYLTPEQLQALESLSTLDAEQAQLQRQLELAAQLRGQKAAPRISPLGAALEGLGNIIGVGAGARQEADLNRRMGDALRRRAAAEAPIAQMKLAGDALRLKKGEQDLKAGEQQMGVTAAEEGRKAAADERLGATIAPELSSMLGQFMPGRDFSNLTYRDLDKMLGPLASLTAKQEGAKDRALQRKLAAEGRQDAAAARAAEAANKRLETDVQKASKDFEEPAGYQDAIATLEEAIKNKDGVGRLEGRLASVGLGSERALKNRQAMAVLGNAVLRARSGAAVTPNEAERVNIETGMAPGASEEQFETGAKAILGVLRRSASSLRAKYRPEVVETIEARGGYTPPAGTPMAPAGAPTAEDRAALDWLQKNPQHPQAAAVAAKLKAKGVAL